MLICRADLEAMLKIMDKFGLNTEYAGLDINYTEHIGGYDLSISFSEIREDIICRTTIELDSDTREQLNEEV